MRATLLTFCLTAASLMLRAQADTLVAADSVAFNAFLRAVELDTVFLAPAPPEEYRMVWMETQFGWNHMFYRVGGTTLAEFIAKKNSRIFLAIDTGFRVTRYAVVVDDPPTGMIHRTTWYFERRR